MSRSIELNPKNVLLLIAALAVFGVVVAAGARWVGRGPAATEKQESHDQASQRPAGANERAHGKSHDELGEHGKDGDLAQREHAEGRVKLTPEAVKIAGLQILTAGPGHVNVTVSLPGEISLNQEALAHVTPRVSGTAREVKKQVGELVRKGDVLAILDSRDIAEAEREFLATRERLALARGNFERAERLQKEHISAEKDFLAAKQGLAEAEIDHRSAAQKLKAIGGGRQGRGGYALVAPFAGTIIEKHINLGEVLNEETRAFTIADLSTIWVNVTVYAKDLPRISVGQAAKVRAEGIPQLAEGSIVYLGHVVGEQTRSATARVVLSNPGPAWRPGLFATAEVTIDHGPAQVVINDEAVQTVDGKSVVFVEEADAFEARAVKLGRKGSLAPDKTKHVLEVLEGLKPGEHYVSKNSFILKAELGKSEAGHEH